METISQDYGDSRLTFRPLLYDCIAFSRNCYELELGLGNTWPDPPAVRALMQQHAMHAVTCRGPAGDVNRRRFLHAVGFVFAEMQFDCTLALAGRQLPERPQGVLRPAGVADDEQILEIAATSFRVVRFYGLRGVTAEMIGTKFRNWTTKILGQQRDLAVVLELDGKIVGYFASERTADPKRVNTTLAASKSTHPRVRLVGYELFSSALAWYGQAGFTLAGATISANNLAVLNLYASLGAGFVRAVEFYQWDALAADVWQPSAS